MPKVFAAADIGSNTVHLLIAEAQGTQLTRLVNESVWLSLGETVSREGSVPNAKVSQLVRTLKAFKRKAEQHRAAKLYVFATEAMRQSTNCDDILKRIQNETGIKVDLISPKREAYLSFGGTLIDSPIQGPGVLVETGGGSAQIAYTYDGKIEKEVSLKIGTGRLKAQYQLTQPADIRQVIEMQDFLRSEIQTLPLADGAPIVSSGGVARGLIRALHPDGERRIDQYEVQYLQQAVMSLSMKTICSRFRVKPKRAETLLAGTSVYLLLLEHFGVESMLVSEYGVREGAILEMLTPSLTS